MTTRLSFSLLIVILLIITSAGVQGSATSASTTETGAPWQKHKEISVVPISDPGDFFSGFRVRDKSILWKVHLALQLVKRPELSGPQVRIILDAIFLSTPEFFEASNEVPSKKTEADDALQSLTRRALSAFPNNQAAELCAMAGGKAEEDILKLYYDVSALPLKETKASFRNASSKDKSDLWRTHLALFLAKRPELNESQRDIILAAMSLATSECFEIRSTDSSWKTKVRDPLRSLEERIVAAFSLADATKIFATLRDDTESTNDRATYAGSILLNSINYEPLSDFGPYKQSTQSRVASQDKDPEKDKEKGKKGKEKLELERSPCECSTQSDYCPLRTICRKVTNCNSTDWGCGTLWNYPCDGSCQ